MPTGQTSWQGFGDAVALPGDDRAATGIALADLDADGDLDVLLTTATGSWSYRNTGCATAATCFAVATPVDVPVGQRAIAVNVDGDTDVDVVTFGGASSAVPTVLQQQAVATTIIGFAGVSIDAGGAKIRDGKGAVILYGGSGREVGMAGTFAGSIDLGSGAIGASASVLLNTTNRVISEVVVVDGTEIPLVFTSSQTGKEDPVGTWKNYYEVSGKLSIRIGSFIEIEGQVTGSGSSWNVAQARIFVGAGPYRLADGSVNPNARGLVLEVTNLTLSGVEGSRELNFQGRATLVGFPGVTVDGEIRFKGKEGGNASAAGTLTLAVSGFALSGSFGFTYDKATGAMSIALGTAVAKKDLTGVDTDTGTGTAITMNLGEGTGTPAVYPVTVTVGSGTLQLVNGGVAANISGVSIGFASSVGLSAITGASLALNTTGATVNGIAPGTVRVVATTDLTIAEQKFSGTFLFEQVTIPAPANAAPGTAPTKQVRIAATNVGMTLGTATAGVVMTGGRGAIILGGGGIAATFSGGVELKVPGAKVTADLAVSVNTGTARVIAQVDIGQGQTVSMDLAPGALRVARRGHRARDRRPADHRQRRRHQGR